MTVPPSPSLLSGPTPSLPSFSLAVKKDMAQGTNRKRFRSEHGRPNRFDNKTRLARGEIRRRFEVKDLDDEDLDFVECLKGECAPTQGMQTLVHFLELRKKVIAQYPRASESEVQILALRHYAGQTGRQLGAGTLATRLGQLRTHATQSKEYTFKAEVFVEWQTLHTAARKRYARLKEDSGTNLHPTDAQEILGRVEEVDPVAACAIFLVTAIGVRFDTVSKMAEGRYALDHSRRMLTVKPNVGKNCMDTKDVYKTTTLIEECVLVPPSTFYRMVGDKACPKYPFEECEAYYIDILLRKLVPEMAVSSSDFRKMFVSHQERKGIPPSELPRLMNHKTRAVTGAHYTFTHQAVRRLHTSRGLPEEELED